MYVYSESTTEGRRVTQLEQILLNGNNITMVTGSRNIGMHFRNCVSVVVFLFQLVPGGDGPDM